MGENDIMQVLLTELNRIKDKLDDISDRISTIEAKNEEKEKHENYTDLEKRVEILEQNKSAFMGAKAIFAWLLTTGISILALLKDWLPHIGR